MASPEYMVPEMKASQQLELQKRRRAATDNTELNVVCVCRPRKRSTPTEPQGGPTKTQLRIKIIKRPPLRAGLQRPSDAVRQEAVEGIFKVIGSQAWWEKGKPCGLTWSCKQKYTMTGALRTLHKGKPNMSR